MKPHHNRKGIPEPTIKRSKKTSVCWTTVAVLMILAFSYLTVPAQVYDAQASSQEAELQPGDIHRILWEGKREQFVRLSSSLAKKAVAGQEDFDVLHYELNLDVDPVSETFDGVVVVEAKSMVGGLTNITLDLWGPRLDFWGPWMTVSSIRSGGKDLSYVHSVNRIDITLDQSYGLDEEFEVAVSYHIRPSRFGIIFDTHSGQPVIFSFNGPEGARTWWPCKDRLSDKATADINITVPADLIAASNGLLVGVVDNKDGTRTYKWRESYPIATYFVSVATSNYVTFSDYYVTATGDSMEVVFYLYPEHSGKADKLPVTLDMIEFFSSLFGEYPFVAEKYGMVEWPREEATAHQTLTSMPPDEFGSDLLIAHELAHQWWGNWVSPESWADVWLVEGLAVYSEALWAEHTGGKAEYHSYMAGIDPGFAPGIMYNSPEIYGYRIVYCKGAWAFHMLRHMVGDRVFFDILRRYGREYGYGNASTGDFQSICEAESGRDLDRFFEEWIYGSGYPVYEFRWDYSVTEAGYDVRLHVEQVHTDVPPFTMPIDITIATALGETTFVVVDSTRSQAFDFTLQNEPVDLFFDRDNWVLGRKSGGRIRIPTAVEGVSEGAALPLGYSLAQNYPNPFNAQTTIAFGLPSSGKVDLSVYNLVGQKVRALVGGVREAGHHLIMWDGKDEEGRDVASGVYLYRLQVGDFVAVRKALLLR